MEDHLYIPGLNDLCWSCGQSRSQHPEYVYRPKVTRRPSRIDTVQGLPRARHGGGQLPWFEVRS